MNGVRAARDFIAEELGRVEYANSRGETVCRQTVNVIGDDELRIVRAGVIYAVKVEQVGVVPGFERSTIQ